MLFGVLSDTHNHLPPTRRAIDALLAAGARRIVHCGDVGPDALDLLCASCLAARVPLFWAWGNCDFGSDDARFAPLQPGLVRADWQVDCSTPDASCLALHGHNPFALRAAVTSGRHDYVFQGHTHHPSAERIGQTWLLNPGSPARPRSAPPSVLLLDTAAARFHWIHLDT